MKNIFNIIAFLLKTYFIKLIFIISTILLFNIVIPSSLIDLIGEVYAEEPNKPPKMSWWESTKNWFNEYGNYILGGLAVIAAIAIAKKAGLLEDTTLSTQTA